MDVMCHIYHITASLTSSGPRSSSLPTLHVKIFISDSTRIFVQLLSIYVNVLYILSLSLGGRVGGEVFYFVITILSFECWTKFWGRVWSSPGIGGRNIMFNYRSHLSIIILYSLTLNIVTSGCQMFSKLKNCHY